MNDPTQVEKPLVDPDVVAQIKSWKGYVQAKLGFRNCWYPTLNSEELEEGKPVPFQLAGEKLLLNRIDGKVYCMADTCLHRGVPLSEKVECYSKETITCWYHGWTYSFTDGNLCARFVHQPQIISGHRDAGSPINDITGAVGQEDMQHLGRADTVKDANAHVPFPAAPDVLRQRLTR